MTNLFMSPKGFRDIFITSFLQRAITKKMQRTITRKNKFLFLKFSPGNLLLILYQLSKFEAPSCNDFKISSFLCPNFQRAITRKKIKHFFLKLSTHYPLSAD